VSVRKNRFEVKEFWGYVSTEDLGKYDPELVAEEKLEGESEVFVNAWMLGPVIIRLEVKPIESISFPYYFYYYDKDEVSLFGEGIPSIMRDTQELFNASIRAMLDNAAICAGPFLEANLVWRCEYHAERPSAEL
jgi:hypothetical protein